MDLTGAQIKALLNEQWNGDQRGSARATQNANKILQVSGLNYTWDISTRRWPAHRRRGQRGLVDADGDPLTADGRRSTTRQTYRVVANNFLADGGDNFATFKAGHEQADRRSGHRLAAPLPAGARPVHRDPDQPDQQP